MEKEACFIVGLMAIRPEHQHEISDKGALRGLVSLLKRHVPGRCPPGPGASVARRASDAITNLAHENVQIKSRVRSEGGVHPLVLLLESFDAKARLGSITCKFTMSLEGWPGLGKGVSVLRRGQTWSAGQIWYPSSIFPVYLQGWCEGAFDVG